MSAAFDQLEVVGLFRTDISQTGTAAGHVNDHSRKFISGKIAHTFLFKTDPQSGTCSHHPASGSGAADNHIDSPDLGFRLNEHAIEFGEKKCRSLCYFTCRGDGISEITVASGKQCTVNSCFVPFQKKSVVQFHRHTSIFCDLYDRNGTGFRALIETGPAADTVSGFFRCNSKIPLFVDYLTHRNEFLRASTHASSAAFTFFAADADLKFFYTHFLYSG